MNKVCTCGHGLEEHYTNITTGLACWCSQCGIKVCAMYIASGEEDMSKKNSKVGNPHSSWFPRCPHGYREKQHSRIGRRAMCECGHDFHPPKEEVEEEVEEVEEVATLTYKGEVFRISNADAAKLVLPQVFAHIALPLLVEVQDLFNKKWIGPEHPLERPASLVDGAINELINILQEEE